MVRPFSDGAISRLPCESTLDIERSGELCRRGASRPRSALVSTCREPRTIETVQQTSIAIIIVVLGMALAVLFVVSGLGKLRSLDSAQRAFTALRIASDHARAGVTVVSIAELALAVGFVVTAGPWLTATAAAATVMLAGFLIVVIRAHRLGSTEDCGCFGDHEGTPVGPRLIVRNSLLVVIATTLLFASVARPSAGVLATLAETAADPAPLVAMCVCALVAAIAFVAAPRGTATVTAPTPDPVIDAAESRSGGPITLLDPADGARVVDVRRMALGRAQLLLFIRPGCGSCIDVIERAHEASTQVDRVARTSLVVTAAIGSTTTPPAFEARGLPTLVDVGAGAASSLGLSHGRPIGVLVATDGSIVEPVAKGRDEIFELIEVIDAAGQ